MTSTHGIKAHLQTLRAGGGIRTTRPHHLHLHRSTTHPHSSSPRSRTTIRGISHTRSRAGCSSLPSSTTCRSRYSHRRVGANSNSSLSRCRGGMHRKRRGSRGGCSSRARRPLPPCSRFLTVFSPASTLGLIRLVRRSRRPVIGLGVCPLMTSQWSLTLARNIVGQCMGHHPSGILTPSSGRRHRCSRMGTGMQVSRRCMTLGSGSLISCRPTTQTTTTAMTTRRRSGRTHHRHGTVPPPAPSMSRIPSTGQRKGQALTTYRRRPWLVLGSTVMYRLLLDKACRGRSTTPRTTRLAMSSM